MAYGDLSAVLSSLSPDEGFEPTGCAGWTAVDLGFHLLSDARRALVALNTPAPGAADTTAVDYWTAWRPPAAGDEEELWSTRIAASVHGGLRGVAARYAETSAAVLVAAGRVAPGVTLLQGPAASLRGVGGRGVLRLVLRLDRPGPAAEPLAETRRV